MIINYASGTLTSLSKRELLRGLLNDYFKYYDAQPSQEAYVKVLFDEIDATNFCNWALKHHRLSMSHFKISQLAFGFEIEEDDHFTVFSLKYSA